MTDPRRPTRPPSQRGHPSAPSEIERAGGASLQVRPERYLVAARSPLDAARIVNGLDQDPQVQVVRIIRPAQRLGSWDFPTVAVAETTAEHAASLAAQPNLHVEVDHFLGYGDTWLRGTDPGVTPIREPVPLAFAITDTDAHPLAGAVVHVLGEQFREHAIADAEGRARLSLPADELDRVQGVYVRPLQGNWSVWLTRPALSTTEPNTVLCHPLESGLAAGWHRRAMGFDRLPPHYLGHGIRIAVIDSGATPEGADLAERLTEGVDVLTQDAKSWREDTLGVGSHVCGLLAATDESARHVALTPEAELQVCRLMPGGRHSDLIEALDYCLTRDVDVVHIGVGSGQWSPLVAQKIEQARQAGIVCVAAAGNTGTAAMFPACLPNVIGVGALGRHGTYPPDSYHATQAQGIPSSDGLFLARFSAVGPGVDVFAPGVAVVSTTPSASFGAADGTSIAAAHVAGLAALVLAHHPDLRDGYRVRSAARVDRLRHAIIATSRPMMFGNPPYLAGLPDAVAAIGLASEAPPMPGSTVALPVTGYPPIVTGYPATAVLLGAGPPVPPRLG